MTTLQPDQHSKHLFKDGPRFTFKKSEYTHATLQKFILTHLDEFSYYDLRCLFSIYEHGIMIYEQEYKLQQKNNLKNKLARKVCHTSTEKLFLMGDYLEAMYNN